MDNFDLKDWIGKDGKFLIRENNEYQNEFFRKKKAEPEVEDDEGVPYPEDNSVNGFTIVLSNKDQIGDAYYYITKGFKNLYESGKIRISSDKSGKIFVKVKDSIKDVKLIELKERAAELLEKLGIEVEYTTPAAPDDAAYPLTYSDYMSEEREDIDAVDQDFMDEPEEAPKPKRLSAADRKAKHRAKYQDRVKANREKAAQRERDRIEDTKNNVLLSNRHSINVYTGKIHALDGSGKIYDSIDDAPDYFLNTLRDRDKHIIWQVTNRRLEEDLQGQDVNALALIRLDSVGHYLDTDTAEVYPINADETPDFENAFSLHDELDEEFINALSERDRLAVSKYTDQV